MVCLIWVVFLIRYNMGYIEVNLTEVPRRMDIAAAALMEVQTAVDYYPRWSQVLATEVDQEWKPL